MVNFKLLPYRDYRNNIKTCIALPIEYLNIFMSGIYDISDFSGSYGFFGCFKRTGEPTWSMTMLTINADYHPLMRRFHKPEDEKRTVVILPDDAWGDWLRTKSENTARALLRGFDVSGFVTEAAPR